MKNSKSILPVGAVLRANDHGFIVSESSVERMVDPWKTAAKHVAECCCEVVGEKLHSAYVRGSASRGDAIQGVSDLDITIITKDRLTGLEAAKLVLVRERLSSEYSFCTRVDIELLPLPKVMSGELKGIFMLKIYSACIYGEDLIPILNEVKPDRDIVQHAIRLRQALQKRLDDIQKEGVDFSEDLCRWVMKQILRSGGELVMEREQAYVRDLYPCYLLFANHYPQRERQMRRVLELAINPTDDFTEVGALVGDLVPWIDG